MSEETQNPELQAAADASAAAAEAGAAVAEAAAAEQRAKEEADAAAAESAKRSGKKVKARVLQDCEHGKTNDLVVLSESDAKAALAAGLIDTHKDAVAYAASLEQNQAKA